MQEAAEALAPAAAVGSRDNSTTATPVLELRGLGKRFGAFDALAGVSLEVRAGEVLCLLGENGAGKSTLCNLIFGVHRPSSGTMRLGGAPFAPADPKAALAAGIGMVHQHFSVVPSMTVVDNLLLGRVGGVLKRRQFAERDPHPRRRVRPGHRSLAARQGHDGGRAAAAGNHQMPDAAPAGAAAR